jgi:putative transcriptional regulator
MIHDLKVNINVLNLWHRLSKENISQTQLAQDLGISKCYLSQLVNGRRHPSPQLRQKILSYFKDSSFDEFFILVGKK